MKHKIDAKSNELFCIKCQKAVADYQGIIDGITTWFAVCSECLFNVKGWTRKDFKKVMRDKV